MRAAMAVCHSPITDNGLNLFLKERKRNVVRSKLFTALALTGMAITSTAYGDLVIDDFATPTGGQFAEDIQPNGVGTWSKLGSQPVLGGARKIFTTTINGSGEEHGIRGEANGDGNEGIFAYDQYTSTYAGQGKLIYDGDATTDSINTGGLGGIDLTGGGQLSSFLLENLVVTGSGLKLTVNLYDAATGNVFTSGPQELINGFSGNLDLAYASFTGFGNALTNVGAIEVLIDGSEIKGSDLTIGRLASTGVTPPAVPEPSSLILAGLASIGGLGFRFRRGKKKETAAAA